MRYSRRVAVYLEQCTDSRHYRAFGAVRKRVACLTLTGVHTFHVLLQLQARENVTVRWDVGLNRKKLAFFTIPRDEVQLRLAPGKQETKDFQ